MVAHEFFWPALLGAGVLLAAAAAWAWRAWRRPRRRLARALRKHARAMLRELRLPDGADGELHFDYVLRLAQGLRVVDVKDFDGAIYGAESLRQWTQVVGHRNFPFDNPLDRLRWRIRVLEAHCPGVPIDGWVVFCGAARFPKGRPPGVYTLDSLPPPAEAAPEAADPAALDAAWETLRIAARGR